MRTLNKWRTKRGLQKETSVPLYVLGVGSGGWFVTNAARVWPDVRAVSVQASVPALKEVQRQQTTEGKPKPFPPMQMVLMERDTAKKEAAEQLLTQEWPGRENAELLVSHPRPVHPTFLSNGIPGLATNVSGAVRAALVAAGAVDGETNKMLKLPVRNELREAVSKAMGTRKSDFPLRSKQLAQDAIFARLDVAYGHEASTCEHMSRTLDFFSRYPGNATGTVTARSHSHGKDHEHSGNGNNATHSHTHNHTRTHHRHIHASKDGSHANKDGSKKTHVQHSDGIRTSHTSKDASPTTKSAKGTKSAAAKASDEGEDAEDVAAAPAPSKQKGGLFSKIFG